MQEKFLYFIWKNQFFEKRNLTTTSGDPLNILRTGFQNYLSGPDFSDARIKIADLLWNGHVEIHVQASDWNTHKHFKDEAYNNVILHVVWKFDKPILREDTTKPPTLELKDIVDPRLIENYEQLLESPTDILCRNQFSEIEDLVKLNMIERALVDRLEMKSDKILELLETNNNDWEETAYQLLVSGFGFKANGEAFQQLARVTPLKILLKHVNDPLQIQAMLFGQAGFLSGKPKDEFQSILKKEYDFLRRKYSLQENVLKESVWKMGRLRPANFPTVRISQLASALVSIKNVHSTFIELDSIQSLRNLFRPNPDPYWNGHFLFGVSAGRKSSRLGRDSADRLIVNIVAPLLTAYSRHVDDPYYMNKAINLLQQLPGEANSITNKWKELGLQFSSSADSQGMIQLYNEFCLKRNCLSCNIGTTILNPGLAR